jgi:hypothetical protein
MRLPNFIIAGAKKAATSSIYDYMKQHPQVYMPRIKELKYFAFEPDNPEHVQAPHQKFPIRTIEEYVQQFAEVNEEIAIGEASPIYINSVAAMHHIRQTIPDVNLIFSLRNPIDRAYSAYWMRVRGGYESRPIQQAFQEDLEHLRKVSYYNMLRQWYNCFDAYQIKVVLFEDFRKDSVKVMQELYGFVGGDITFVPNTSVQHNAGGMPKSQARQGIVNYLRKYRRLRFYLPKTVRSIFANFAKANLTAPPPIPTDVQEMLAELYCEEIDQLSNLIQKDLSVWGLTAPQYVAQRGR